MKQLLGKSLQDDLKLVGHQIVVRHPAMDYVNYSFNYCLICYTSKMAKLVRWLHLQVTSVMFGLELLLVLHPSDDHPP